MSVHIQTKEGTFVNGVTDTVNKTYSKTTIVHVSISRWLRNDFLNLIKEIEFKGSKVLCLEDKGWFWSKFKIESDPTAIKYLEMWLNHKKEIL